jgi:hypothetical protein
MSHNDLTALTVTSASHATTGDDASKYTGTSAPSTFSVMSKLTLSENPLSLTGRLHNNRKFNASGLMNASTGTRMMSYIASLIGNFMSAKKTECQPHIYTEVSMG